MLRHATRLCALAALAAVAVLATPAVAVDPPEDLGYGVLGIYTAPAAGPGAEVFLDDVVPGTVYTVHFVLYHHRLTSYNLGGFEFSWRVEPAGMAPVVLDLNWAVDDAYVYNFGDPFDLQVGFARRDPHAPDEPWLLFSAELMFTETPNNARVFLGPSSLGSIAGEMVYADLIFPEELHVMRPNNASQSLDEPVFTFNPTVAVEHHTLSGVKALFD